jgi:hypothetical protein
MIHRAVRSCGLSLLLPLFLAIAAAEPLSGLDCKYRLFHHRAFSQPREHQLPAPAVWVLMVVVALVWIALPLRLLGRPVLRRLPTAVQRPAAVVGMALLVGLRKRALLSFVVHATCSVLHVCRVPFQEHSPAYRVFEALEPPDHASLPLFTEIDAAEFDHTRIAEYTHGFTHGLVVRGLTAHTPAARKWTFDYFQRHPDARHHKTLSHHLGNVGVTASMEDLMQTNVKRDALELNAANLFSISDFHIIPQNVATLKHDLQLDELVPTLYHGAPLAQQTLAHQFNMHLAPSDATEVCESRGFGWHAAPGWNLATLLRGAKNWTFVSHKNLIYLRPYWTDPGTLYSLWGHEPYANDTDPGRYTEFPVKTITQRAGDVIYFPAWLPHKTHQVAAEGAENEVILVTYRGLELGGECLRTDAGIALRYLASQAVQGSKKWELQLAFLKHKLGLLSYDSYMKAHGGSYASYGKG